MRELGRIFLGVSAVALAIAVAVIAFRGPSTHALLRHALIGAGLENPEFKIRSVSPGKIEIADLRSGADPQAPDLSVDAIEARFDIGEVLAKRAINAISIGPGRVRIVIEEDGVTIGGVPLKRGGEAARDLPLEALKVDDLELIVVGATGNANARVSGALDVATGGEFTIRGDAPNFSAGAIGLDGATFAATIDFARTGELRAKADFRGGVRAFGVVAESAALGVEGAASPWSGLLGGKPHSLAGGGQIDIQTLKIRADESPLLSGPASGAAIETIEGAGRIAVEFGGGRLAVLSDKGVLLRSGGDETTTIKGDGSRPLYERDSGGARISLDASMAGARAGSASLRARSENGPWVYEANARFADRAFGGVGFGPTAVSSRGKIGEGAASGDLELETHIRAAKVGRLEIVDAFVTTRASLAADLEGKTIAFSSAEGDCLRMSSGRFGLEGQNSEGRLGSARLCRSDGPLLVAEWGERRRASVVGELTADTGFYRIGATRFEGVPPALALQAEYDPALQLTTMTGTLLGGRVVINGALIASESAGSISARLEKAALSGEAGLDRVTIVQNKRPLQIAPIRAAGTARLADEKIAFDYAAATPAGVPLGKGVGAHDVRLGVGETVFRSGRLAFARGRLQPSALLPPLRGIVGDAAGSAEGEARFAWGRRASDFRSSGAISVANLRFIGPGRAVSATSGVSGALQLDSLAPLKSAGEHSLTVKLVDLDALKLENGTIRYELPGDSTLRVIVAEFPWFGGRIGAYDAVAPLIGGKIDLSLKAETVSLKDMLEFIDIEGLSGEGIIEGVLPLSIAEGKARIVEGAMSAKGPGVIRYVGKAAEAAASADSQAKLAFDILRELHFEELTAKVDGPLDGDLNFNIVFKGTNSVTIDGRAVASPIVYRISIEAPLLALIDQARMSADFRLQMQRQEEAPVED
jgi:hypothetical protein